MRMTPVPGAIATLLNRVEDTRFTAEVNLASGLGQAERICLNHEISRKLVEELRDSPAGVGEVLERVRCLAVRQIDMRYESPFDVAFLAMILALKEVDGTAARAAAAMIAGAPQTWWARQAAQRVMQRPAEGSVSVVFKVTPFGRWGQRTDVDQSDQDEVQETHVDLSRVFPNVAFVRSMAQAAAVIVALVVFEGAFARASASGPGANVKAGSSETTVVFMSARAS